MWPRNLLFIATCLVAAGLVGSFVYPLREKDARELAAFEPQSIESAVAALDAKFSQIWTERGVQPLPPATELLVARRLALGLVGTLPSLAEIRQFEAHSAGARGDWYLSLILADRRYADFVAERLARVIVGSEDGPFLLFRRRRFVSWLADQFHANRPFDALVRDVIASSGLWTDTPATNFISVAIKPDSDENPDPVKLAARTARAFLGIRLDCAECHDHPFEDWKQTDFQHLAAYFARTRRSLRGIYDDAQGEYELDDPRTGEQRSIAPGVPYAPELATSGENRRAELAGWITHRQTKALARVTANRAWAMLFGKPLVEPIDDIPAGGAWREVLDVLADDFIDHGYDWQRLLRVIAASRAFRADSAAPADAAEQTVSVEQEETWAAFPLVRLRPEQVAGAILQAASLETIDYDSHIVTRVFRTLRTNDFVQRYGDGGAEEFEPKGGTIPQRLIMMNGELVKEKTKESIIGNAATRIAWLAPDDGKAVETAALAVLTRRPTNDELDYFASRLAGTARSERAGRLEDLYWTLLNSAEFAWNH